MTMPVKVYPNNPCNSCVHHLTANPDDDTAYKNNPVCQNCNDRLAYFDLIEDPDYNEIPVKTKETKAKMKEKSKTKKCRDCGETKPLEEFPSIATSPDGYGHICALCRGRRIKAAKDEKRESHKDNPDYKDNTQIKVTLDFRRHTDVLDWIRKRARDELRTIENQAVWELSQLFLTEDTDEI